MVDFEELEVLQANQQRFEAALAFACRKIGANYGYPNFAEAIQMADNLLAELKK